MLKKRNWNKNGLMNRLMSKGFVFGTLVMLFVAIIASVGMIVATNEGIFTIKSVYPSLSPDWKKIDFIGSSLGFGIIPDYPEIREIHHDMEGVGHNSTQIHSTAILYNPNIFPIKFKRVEYSIFLNDILIGSGHSEENIVVLPKSEKKLAFESAIYLKQIPKWLKERIKTREETDVNIKGTITFDLGIFDYKHPINISVTEIWKKRFNNSFSFAYPATDLTGDKISEMIIDVWHFEDDYIFGEVRVVDGVDGSLLWNRSLGVGIPVAYPATDLNGDNITDFIVNLWDIDSNLATQILILDGFDGSKLWEWGDDDGLAAAYPCTDFNGDNITEILVNSYSIVEEERSLSTPTAAIQAMAKMEAENVTDMHIMRDRELDRMDSSLTNYTYLRLNVRPQDVIKGKRANVEFSATLSDFSGNVVPNKTLIFYVGGNIIGSRKTESGWASISYDTSNLALGSYEIKVVFEGDSQYKQSSERVILMVNPSTEPIQDHEFSSILKGEERRFVQERRITPADDGLLEYGVSNFTGVENRSHLSPIISQSAGGGGGGGGSLSSASFTDYYTDYGIDTDSDGKYNYLAIDVGVDVKKAGKYSIEGSLKDNSTGDHIQWAPTDRILDAGVQNVTLKFNGYQIYRHGTNGKFDLKDLEAKDKDWNPQDYRDYAYTTSFYSFAAFDVPPADITGSYSNYGFDTDGDGKYNYLVIDVWVSVSEAGTYWVYGRLEDSGDQYITSEWDDAYLNTGLQKITLKFNGYDIYRHGVNGPFKLGYVELNVYDGEDWYMVDQEWDAYNTPFYYYTDFDVPPAGLTGSYSDYGIDADGDGKYDYLAIDAWVSVKEAGYYSVRGWLDDSYGQGVIHDWNNSYLDIGLQKITLKFNGYEIYRNGVGGSFSLGYVELRDNNGDIVDRRWDDYVTSYYDYTDFDVPPIGLTGSYADYGVDKDGNGRYDYLIIEVGVNVKEAGRYWVYGQLNDNENDYITSGWDEVELSTGLQKFTLKFDGYRIYRNGVDGPFGLGYVELYDKWNRADYEWVAYVTSYYNHTEFDRKFTGNFIDYGSDTDEDGLYNYLVVESEINVTNAGEYELSGSLQYYDEENGYWEWIDWDWNETYLEAGIQNVTLRFDGIRIYSSGYSGSFKALLRLYETEEGNRIDEMEYFTSDYSYTDFQKPPAEFVAGFNDYGLDTDGNSLYDYLVIEKEINVREAGNYELYGSLRAPSGEWIDSDSNYTYLDVGLHSVELKFYGPSIYNSGESGKFSVHMDLYDADNWNWLDSTTDSTKAYDYTEFELPPAEFTGNFYDYGLDIGEDGLYNYLVVESEINVTNAGEYELSGSLQYYDEENGYWEWIDWDWNETYLEAGIQNVTLRFDGIRIYSSGYSGSFKAELRLYDTEGMIDDAEYFTSYYNYTEFNPTRPREIPVTEIYVFDGSSGVELWNKSIRNCLAAAYPTSDIDGDNVSELLINKWIMEDDEISFSKIEIVKGMDSSELWNMSFANCFAVAYPVSDLNGDNVTELLVNAWGFEERGLSTTGVSILTGTSESTPTPVVTPTPTPAPSPSEIPVTEIFVIDGQDGSLLWNRSVTEGYLAAAYPVTDFTGDNITEIAINAFNEIPSTIIEVVDGVDGTLLWSKTINNSLSAIYPSTDLTKDGISELMINSWHFSGEILSGSEILIVNGVSGSILWNWSTEDGFAVAYPATDLTLNNVSEIIINVWGPELESTKIFIFEGLTHTELFSKTMNNSLAAAYPISDLTGDNVSEVAVNELNLEEEATTIAILSIKPSVGIFDTGEGTYPSIMGTHKGEIKPFHNINVSKLYTYPCVGTGGHTESIKLYENDELIASGTWNGYHDDYHNISITPSVTLLAGHTYNYTIVTGSYPQIIHEHEYKNATGGTITCTSFVDANGKTYTDWIPAIRLE